MFLLKILQNNCLKVPKMHNLGIIKILTHLICLIKEPKYKKIYLNFFYLVSLDKTMIAIL